MSNSQSITPTLPVLSAVKTSPPPSETKVNNTFNQVLKNEVASKTKKNPVEAPKTTISNQNKSPASNAPASAKVNNNESQARNDEKIDDDESNRNDATLGNLNDTAALLNFVNNVNTLAQANKTGTEQDDVALDIGKTTEAIAAAPIVNANLSTAASSLDASTNTYAATQELLNGALQKTPTDIAPDNTVEIALHAQGNDTEVAIAATPSASATATASASASATLINQAPPTNQTTPNSQNLIIGDLIVASNAEKITDTKSLADTPQTDIANLNNTNSVTEIDVPVMPILTNNEVSTNTDGLSNDKLPIVQTASNDTTNAASNSVETSQANKRPETSLPATSETLDASSSLQSANTVSAANLNVVEKSPVQVPSGLSQEIQNSYNLSQTIPATKMREVSSIPSNEVELVLPASTKMDATISSAKIPATNETTVTPATSPATPQVNEKSTTTNLRSDRADLSLSGLGANALFSDELSAKFAQVEQEQNVVQKSEAIDEFAINATKPEVVAAQPAIQTAAAAAVSSLATEYIGARFGTKAWDQAIGQKIVWMVAGGEQTAQLTLNPPDLGPVQVVLSISDSFVDASFVSSHLDVREAIEAAAPKLREMMDNAGISLSGFSVSAESAQSGNAFSSDKSQQSSSAQLRNANKADATAESATQNMPISRPSQEQGLVDTFA